MESTKNKKHLWIQHETKDYFWSCYNCGKTVYSLRKPETKEECKKELDNSKK